MKPLHVSADQAERFRRGSLPPDEVLAIGRHVAACEDCSRLVRRTGGSGHALERLRTAFAEEPEEHPEVETVLAAYVDGSFSGDQRELIRHLQRCPQCREDIADMMSERERLARPRRMLALAVAAGAAIVIVAAALAFRQHDRPAPPKSSAPPLARSQSPPPPVGYGRADWDAAARATELPPPPIIARLQLGRDPLRGNTKQNAMSVEPDGVVVMETSPRFTWTPVDGAQYVVSIFRGSKEVAESGILRANSWTPPAPLARGADYTWQVEARNGDSVTVFPAPPALPAMFRIVDQRTLDDIAAARERFPNDPLLLGVLYARAGVQREAERELSASNDPRAQRLLRDVRRWREGGE